MTITPLELLDTSIAQLQALVTFLDDQLSWSESAALETQACEEGNGAVQRCCGDLAH